MSVKDTTELRLFRKTDSFAPRPTVCLCPGIGCVVVAGVARVVVCPSAWSPAVFHPVSSSTTVLANVDVCVACVAGASTFLI